MKNIHICSFRVKLILAYQRGAKISLALSEPKQVALHSNSNTTSELAPSQVERKK